MIHPTTAVEGLRKQKLIPEDWSSAYFARKLETKEPTHEARMKKREADAKVVPIAPAASPIKIAKVVVKKQG